MVVLIHSLGMVRGGAGGERWCWVVMRGPGQLRGRACVCTWSDRGELGGSLRFEDRKSRSSRSVMHLLMRFAGLGVAP